MDDSSCKNMREQFGDAKELNQQLKEKMATAQGKYMDQAESRLGFQRPMGRILSMINASENGPLIDAAYEIAEKCETKARKRMEALEAEWGPTGRRTAAMMMDQSEKDHGTPESQLEDNLNKYFDKNVQLKLDLKNRKAYLEAETKIQADYKHGLEKIVAMMKKKCEDSALVEKVEKVAAQTKVTC